MNPKEDMIHTIQTIWKQASQVKRTYIKNIWEVIMKEACVLSWKPSNQANEYQLELEEDILGNHPEIPMGQLVMKKKMKIGFIEEKIPGTETYRQVIHFPDQGLCFRIGIGWFSKDNPLQRILIEEDSQQEIKCSVEILGQNIVRSANETLAFWKKAEWKSA